MYHLLKLLVTTKSYAFNSTTDNGNAKAIMTNDNNDLINFT